MTSERPPPPDARVTLPDGRRLGYREYGDPDGAPVVSCHGGLLCGLDAAAYDAAAAHAGLRLLSPDRPGLGESTAAPERTTADWAADVTGLLDALGIDRVAVLGWSMGGQYALACAALAPERVTRAVVVAGALPLDDPATFAELNAMDRRLTRLAQHHPHVAREVFGALADVARHRPAAWGHLTERAAPPDESTAIDALADAGLAHTAAVALAHGEGMVEEYRAWARPWGFTPEAVTVPVTVWQGDADTLVPASWGATLAARVAGARLVAVPGAGHFVALTHTADVLADLRG